MNPDMIDNGRRLETQVADLMRLLADIQRALSEITDNRSITRAARTLSQQRRALTETAHKLQQGQADLERQLGESVSQLASREAALEASRRQLRDLTRRLVQVQEDERRSLARDLHDSAGQAMTIIGLGLSMLRRQGDCTERMRGRIDELQAAAAAVAEDLHRLSANLRPSTLDRYGLVPAAEQLVASLRRRTEIDVEFNVEGLEERFPEEVETALYRVIQEACTNMARYAAAKHASVSIWREDDVVRVCVKDDGRGFDLAEALSRGRLGLVGMRERAEILGGNFSVETSPGKGASVSVDVPVSGAGTVGEAAGSGETVAPVEPAVSSEAARSARVRALADALVDITAGMAGLENGQDALTFVLARATTALGCDYAVIAEHDGRRWVISHAYGLPGSLIGQRLVPAAVPLAEEIRKTAGTVIVNDTSTDNPLAVAARHSGVFSGVGLPLRGNGRFLGSVAFAHTTDPVPFKPSEVAFLQQLSPVISLLLEVLQLRAANPSVG